MAETASGQAVAARLVRKGKGGVFYLYGDEPFLKEEAVRALIEVHLDPATRDFNLDPLRGGEITDEGLASILGTPPMMAEWRVVVLRETEALASSARGRQRLLEVVQAPPPGLCLILSCTVPSGSTAKFYRDLEAIPRRYAFRPVDPADLPAWIMDRAEAAHSVVIEEDAARALAQGTGADLGLLTHELAKLSSMVEADAPITLAHVEAGGTRIPRQDRWGWFDLVGERKFPAALEGLAILLDHGESGVGLTGGLGTHLLRLAVLRSGGQAALTPLLGPRQAWLARKLQPQAQQWEPEALESAIVGLYKVDRLLKASGFSDRHLLETWLQEQAVRA
jgi:DNA polymerase III subunit delta